MFPSIGGVPISQRRLACWASVGCNPSTSIIEICFGVRIYRAKIACCRDNTVTTTGTADSMLAAFLSPVKRQKRWTTAIWQKTIMVMETDSLLVSSKLETQTLEPGWNNFLVAARYMRDVLQAKGYTVFYSEFSGGHNPMNWRGTLANGLLAPLEKKPINKNESAPVFLPTPPRPAQFRPLFDGRLRYSLVENG